MHRFKTIFLIVSLGLQPLRSTDLFNFLALENLGDLWPLEAEDFQSVPSNDLRSTDEAADPFARVFASPSTTPSKPTQPAPRKNSRTDESILAVSAPAPALDDDSNQHNYQTNHPANRRVHKRKSTVKKVPECDVCNKVFTDASQLNRHSRIHTGIKPYTCDVCNQAFTQQSNLKSHKQTKRHKKIVWALKKQSR